MAKKKLVKSKRLVSKGTKNMSPHSRKARQIALEEHLNREQQAIALDDDLDAKPAKTLGQWLDNPNRYDIHGVDEPIDWRDIDERKLLKELEDGTVPWARIVGTEPAEATKLRLQFQKKYRMISGRLVTGAGERWDGVAQYMWAIQNNVDAGFDLRRPEAAFIDEYNLKRYDVFGLHVMVIPYDAEIMKGATGFYVEREKIMVLPPKEGTFGGDPLSFLENPKERTIRHEIGHHIYNSSDAWREIWRRHRTNTFKNVGSPLKVPPAETPTLAQAIREQDKYFDNLLPSRDIESNWGEHYRRKGLRGYAFQALLDNEAWAETFRVYRNGELKKRYKSVMKTYEFNKDAYKDAADNYERIRDIPKSKRTDAQNNDFLTYRKEMQYAEREMLKYGALVDNFATLLKALKEADNKQWWRGRMTWEGKVTAKTLRPVELKEGDFLMYEADIEALDLKRKPKKKGG